jgi:hypothetical protein
MEKIIIIQGREISPKDIEFIREMIKANPSWGHTRQDRSHTLKVPIKDIYLLPLVKRFREALKS